MNQRKNYGKIGMLEYGQIHETVTEKEPEREDRQKYGACPPSPILFPSYAAMGYGGGGCEIYGVSGHG